MNLHLVFVILGGLLLVGLAADEIGRRTRLPRVTLLIAFGLVAGPWCLDLLPKEFRDWYEFLSIAALTMVAFLLGGTLSFASMRRRGKNILIVSVTAVFVTAIIVGAGLLAIGVTLVIALLLAGIATATAPAATQDVVQQTHAKGPFTKTLLGIVAIDDAWGLIIFSFLLVAAKVVMGEDGITLIVQGVWEIAGAAVVGILIGFPAAYLTGRLRPGEPMQLEALGVVFLCAGLAHWIGASFLLAGMVAGAVIVNFATHHSRAFHEIEHIERPFMVLFFVLAGASLDVEQLTQIGGVGIAYLFLRTLGRLAGGWAGGAMAGLDPVHRRWIGPALVPQAGVALGMALVASNHFPEHGAVLLTITVGSTVIFELFGPLLTQQALRKVGEAK